MPRHTRTQHPHRRKRVNLDPHQSRTIRLQSIRITNRRTIIRLHRRRRRRIRHLTPIRRHRHVPTNNRLRARIAHPVRPEIVHVPGLYELGHRGVIARGDEVDEDVVHGCGHCGGGGASVDKRDGVVAAI